MNIHTSPRRCLRALALVSLTILAACSSDPSDETQAGAGENTSSNGTGEAHAQSGPGATFRPTEAVALKGQLGISTLRIIISEHASNFCDAPNVEYASSRYVELNLTLGDQDVEVKTYDIESREASASLGALDNACEFSDSIHADKGTVTIVEVSATSVRGTFSIVLDGAPMEGAFDTPICDLDKATAKLPADAKRECH